MAPQARKRCAFTIIELLVVIGIIALLIAILLPAFSMAREQSRIVKCMANAQKIGGAAQMQIIEVGDLPWTKPINLIAPGASSNQYSFSYPTPFIWGGSIPDRTAGEFENARPVVPAQSPAEYDVYRVPPRMRDMNRYIMSDMSWDCEPSEDVTIPRLNPSETPDIFRCPSDTFATMPTIGRNTPQASSITENSTWEFWGTSYASNWYWGAYYFRAPPGMAPPYAGGGISLGQSRLWRNLGFYAPRPEGIGKYMFRSRRANWDSEFVIFMENSLNWSLEIARAPGDTQSGPGPEDRTSIGWHRQQNRHVATFLDGSVRYRTMDPRYTVGEGWTVWPARPWAGYWMQFSEVAP